MLTKIIRYGWHTTNSHTYLGGGQMSNMTVNGAVSALEDLNGTYTY